MLYKYFMIVMKFGGSSVENSDRIREVAEIVRSKGKVCVVFSAMKGITDLLIKAGYLAEAGDLAYKDVVSEIRDRQVVAMEDLMNSNSVCVEKIEALLEELEEVLYGVYLIRNCSERSYDLILSFGERLNCVLISEFFNFSGIEAEFVDAREIIKSDDSYGSANVDFEKSVPLIAKKLGSVSNVAVITGFIASSEDGTTTTLGRNGSDYSASIVGNAVGAERVEIWKDVDGVYTANPQVVKNAVIVPELNTAEAMELSYFGAEVIHPYTMYPAVEKDIPIYIKNTMNPSAEGTKISKNVKPHGYDITGIASIDSVSLINVEGSGMIGKPGIAAEVFTALAEAKINIIMISQSSSEHSICFVCRSSESEKAENILREALAKDLKHKVISDIKVINNLATVSIIGENMIGRPGIAGKIFSAMGDNSINILAIAQGSSERNISIIVEDSDKNRAINVIHSAIIN